MTIKAKFMVESIKEVHTEQTEGLINPNPKEVLLRTVMIDGANKNWSKYTPQGEIKMTIMNPKVNFVLGQTYDVTFECEK